MSLVLTRLAKWYGAGTVVDDLSMTAGKGEFIALLGPSGCGKTTTLRMIAGFIEPSAGRIDGRDVTRLPPDRRNIGLVFQNYALFPHMGVQANVEFGLRCHGASAALRRDVVVLSGTVETVVALPDGTTLTVHEPDGDTATRRQPGDAMHVAAAGADLRLLAL